jgi:hypothetical protein
VGLGAAASGEADAAVEMDGLIAVEGTELDGNLAGTGTLDCFLENGCPDAATRNSGSATSSRT